MDLLKITDHQLDLCAQAGPASTLFFLCLDAQESGYCALRRKDAALILGKTLPTISKYTKVLLQLGLLCTPEKNFQFAIAPDPTLDGTAGFNYITFPASWIYNDLSPRAFVLWLRLFQVAYVTAAKNWKLQPNRNLRLFSENYKNISEIEISRSYETLGKLCGVKSRDTVAKYLTDFLIGGAISISKLSDDDTHYRSTNKIRITQLMNPYFIRKQARPRLTTPTTSAPDLSGWYLIKDVAKGDKLCTLPEGYSYLTYLISPNTPMQQINFVSEYGAVPYNKNVTKTANHYIYITSAPIGCNLPALDPSVADLSSLSRLPQVPTSDSELLKFWPSLYRAV